MRRKILVALIVLLMIFALIVTLFPAIYGQEESRTANKIETVFIPNRSPLVTFRLLFLTGAADDPIGKEGVAALTAAMLAKGGSRTRSYDRIVEAMYPMAASLDWQTDKEMTVFSGTTHVDNLEHYYALISELLLDPGFRQEDFMRLKTDAINFLKVSLRDGNDEELAKEHLYNIIYAGHPYGHHNLGRLDALEKLTLDDVHDFYRRHYTEANLVIGLAGGYPVGFPRKVIADFARLPKGRREQPRTAMPKLAPGTRIEIIERETRSTAISLGFPIDVKRGDKDWAALALAVSYFGQHRSSNSYLFRKLREERGLNYGDYAYIEYFPRGMFQFTPAPNLGREQQIFQIWIRPVEPQNAFFALRAALYEYDKLLREGISHKAFEATRQFLLKYANVLTQTQDAQLGYALDSRYYGIPEFGLYLREQLSKLMLEEVNRAIRKRLHTENMRIVIVTKDAEALREAILGEKPSPITYLSPKSKEILAEDKMIEAYPIGVKQEAVVVFPNERIFN
jgi:zinc protease